MLTRSLLRSLSSPRSTLSLPRPTSFAFSTSRSPAMPRTADTASFKFNHTMIRVKDPQASLKFYTEVLGMDLITKNEFSDFTLYFLAYSHDGQPPTTASSRFAREGILELTHNHGTESDPAFAGYASGNADPGRGFGHIAISVPDIHAACARFDALGVPFKKRLTDGKMRNIAFILDPDGYWVEIVPVSLEPAISA